MRTDASALVEDVKVVADKLIVKGEALIKVLYMGSIENGTLETMEFSIPVSQIVDAPGTDEGCLCDARLSVMDALCRSEPTATARTPCCPAK